MIPESCAKNVLPKELMSFWQSKGCEVEAVWAKRWGDILEVDFRCDSASGTRMYCGLDDAIRWLIYFIVKKGYSKGIRFFQSFVLVRRMRFNDDQSLLSFGCDSYRLRELESRRHSIFKPLSRMKVSDMINRKRVRDQRVLYSKFLNHDKYPEWLDDDMTLGSYLLSCAEGDWLNLSEICHLVEKITFGEGSSDDAAKERAARIIGYLLENGFMQVGEVAMHKGEGETDERPCFHDSGLPHGRQLAVVREEIRNVFENGAYRATLWFRNTDKVKEFDLAHKAESDRLWSGILMYSRVN